MDRTSGINDAYQEKADQITNTDEMLMKMNSSRLILLVATALLLTTITPVAKEIYQAYNSKSAFRNKIDGSQLIGKTSKQVITLLGKPHSTATYLNGDCDFVYDGPYGDTCRVEVRGGKANSVVYWNK